MDEQDMMPRDAAEEILEGFPQDAIEVVTGSVDRVLSTCTRRIRQEAFVPAIGDDADGKTDEVAGACDCLEAIWRPRVLRHMHESVLWGCRKDRSMPEEALRWLAGVVAPKEADRLCEAANPKEASPYGIPFVRASSVAGGGGEDRDRKLLMSPYALRDDSCLLVSLVPHEEPGMADALLLPAAEVALETMALPGEASRLRAAREFVLPNDDGFHIWDAEETVGWFDGIRSKCEDTAVGRLAVTLGRRLGSSGSSANAAIAGGDLRDPDMPQWPEGGYGRRLDSSEFAGPRMKRAVATFLAPWERTLNDLLIRAYMEAYDNDPFSDVDIRYEVDRMMKCIPRFVGGGSLAEAAERGVSWQQIREDPRKVLFAKEEETLARLCLETRLSSWVLPIEVRFRDTSLLEDLLSMPQRDLMGEFERIAVQEGYFRSLDPILAVGFAALGAGAAMPEAESLLRTMAGWARMCWATSVLSHPGYGGPLSRPARPVDALAGVAEIKQRYDEIVPTLEPVWREAFERQWIPFVREIEETGQLCDETNRE